MPPVSSMAILRKYIPVDQSIALKRNVLLKIEDLQGFAADFF
jgi:hypothetical protein